MILDRFRLDGKVAVVTGAGRGIGAATALALAEAGADVLISARTEDDLRAVADRIATTGRKAALVVGDLSDLDLVASLSERAVDAFGRLDVVVNNVGGEMPRPLMKTSVRRLESSFHFNVSTAHALTTAAVPALLETGGAIVNISSVMGRLPARGYAAYGTAKAALAHYTRIAAADLAPRVRVNAIAVGSIATSALELVLGNDELRTTMEQNTPLKRIGDAEDIAAAVVYLSSPAGAYVTGAILQVDGGLRTPNLDLGLPDL
ncbi:SDR family oxidoreductase [Cryptosporangium japonicum]|uniref:SDR family oxidoreductase n=1 Tax=Cryptosporangium japonicum TaxID=80872 RepID=A0ABP3D5S3_9ACTN